jgi:hypothetical protein
MSATIQNQMLKYRAVNRDAEHPSHEVHACAHKAFAEAGEDFGALTPVERNLMRASIF